MPCDSCDCGGDLATQQNTQQSTQQTTKQKALLRSCPKCSGQGHPVTTAVLANVLKKESAQGYTGEDPHLCLNPTCEIAYFDPNTNETLQNADCETGIWFKESAANSYICYCEKITEKEIIKTVVETGLDDLGSVMLYLRESIGQDCSTKQPASIPCNRYVQEAIEKGQIVREALLNYKDLEPNSKDVPYPLIEERYNKYLLASGEMAEAGGGCCGGGCHT